MIKVSGAQIHYQSKGLQNRTEGQPVIVFESGLGTPMDNWEKVWEPISNFAPVFAYDRPGIGKSEQIEEIPTVENVSTRLVALLSTLGIDPPYILVGHSLGGMYIRGFANLYPELLAGLVIIDPADFTENESNIRDHYDVMDWEPDKVDSVIQSFIEQRRKSRSNAPGAIQREGEVLEDIRANNFEAINIKKLPNIPVHILTGGRFDKPVEMRSKAYDEEVLFRSKMEHRMARWTEVIQSVERGKFFYSSHSGHFVQWDDPMLVVASIRMVLADYQELMER